MLEEKYVIIRSKVKLFVLCGLGCLYARQHYHRSDASGQGNSFLWYSENDLHAI